MPGLWHPQLVHRLAKNYNLAKKVLESNYNKLRRNPDRLILYNEAIKDQESQNIIEKIPDLKKYLNKNPNVSFLAHTGVKSIFIICW